MSKEKCDCNLLGGCPKCRLSPPPVVGDLREKIALAIQQAGFAYKSGRTIIEPNYSLGKADSILAIIKEAGYVKLDFVLNKLSMYKGHGIEQLIEYLKQAGG